MSHQINTDSKGFAGSLHHNHDPKCCHMIPPKHHDGYHTSGKMHENAFSLIEGVPHLVDNTNVTYGPRISVSEQVRTNVVQRRDISCVNLDAKFDMTGMLETNTVLNHYVEQIITNTNDDLQGILPVVKTDYVFKLYYTIKDSMGDIVSQSTTTVHPCPMKYCSTDVQDYYLTTANGIMVWNIPSMEFCGMYTLTINRMELQANVIDVKEHIVDKLNPYYQFTNNNTKIMVQHDTIDSTLHDSTITVAACDLDYSVPFQSNVTTRVKMSFISYMSLFISTRNTFNIWNAMNYTIKNIIDKLSTFFEELDDRVTALEEIIGDDTIDTTVSSELTQLRTSLTTLTTSIDKNSNDISGLKTSINKNSTDITDINTSLSTLSTSINKNSTDIDDINTSLTSLSTSINKNSTDIDDINTSLTTLTTSMDKNATDITDINTSLTSLSTSINKNSTDITDLDTSITDINTSLSTLSTSITKNSTDIDKNSTDITGLDTRVTALENPA